MFFYEKLLLIFGVPKGNMDPRLFGNMVLAMIMVYKAMPDTMPFLFAELADDMVNIQIDGLLDELERAKAKHI